jgi:hypothetical protein
MLDANYAVIIGGNLSEVAAYAKLDLGWKRLSVSVWADEDGCEVRYAGMPSRLERVSVGSKVYLVGTYWNRDDWWEMEEAIIARALQIHHL